ncbi:hypothetical protein CHRY9393_03224 [Chryseobacterium fistulae]|uniref:Uncharacterized protein n=1 Tax=Chryseobacterium fistulae TaxID=2675058 RepID=A0A6N4XSS5_9FLAO|nr:hypothetical protein CHRY9393_03224 [Chryseobacterium fistulae]
MRQYERQFYHHKVIKFKYIIILSKGQVKNNRNIKTGRVKTMTWLITKTVVLFNYLEKPNYYLLFKLS